MKKIKVSEIITVSQILDSAKYTELEKADKSKLLRITLAMKEVTDKFNEDTKTVAEKLKKSDFKDYDEHLSKAQEFERIHQSNGDMSKAPIGAAEYDKFLKEEHIPFNELVNETMKPYAEKEISLDVELLSESAFDGLMSSNDWTIGQVKFLAGYIREEKKDETKAEKKKKD